MHDDRELARNRDFGASHANSFRQPEAPALQDRGAAISIEEHGGGFVEISA